MHFCVGFDILFYGWYPNATPGLDLTWRSVLNSAETFGPQEAIRKNLHEQMSFRLNSKRNCRSALTFKSSEMFCYLFQELNWNSLLRFGHWAGLGWGRYYGMMIWNNAWRNSSCLKKIIKSSISDWLTISVACSDWLRVSKIPINHWDSFKHHFESVSKGAILR